MLLMGMYWPEIQAFKASLEGLPAVANGGVASILCPFPNPNQNNLGYLFFTEFFVDSYIVGGESRPKLLTY
jgi:glycerol uptake facilitator-like aquaporin